MIRMIERVATQIDIHEDCMDYWKALVGTKVYTCLEIMLGEGSPATVQSGPFALRVTMNVVVVSFIVLIPGPARR